MKTGVESFNTLCGDAETRNYTKDNRIIFSLFVQDFTCKSCINLLNIQQVLSESNC